MKNMIKTILLFALAFPLAFTACTSLVPAPAVTLPATPSKESTESPTPAQEATKSFPITQPENTELTLEDAQGAVIVVITPLNLSQPGESLNFEVKMDTHSVDLSMDLAQLASLATDTGKSVSPLKWDAPMGGHHVSGILSFPSSVEGAYLLDGVTKLTLTIRDVDVPERIFTWLLPV